MHPAAGNGSNRTEIRTDKDVLVTISGDACFAADAFVTGFRPPERPLGSPTAVQLAEYDRSTRHWTSVHMGDWRVGSEIHKHEVCKMFRETFNPYRPAVIDWPELDSEELARLTSLPIWDIAVQTEGKARLSFAAYAGALADREMAEALMLNAWEENRHRDVLSNLVKTYGISLVEEPAYEPPRDLEWAHLVTGYSECVDSFFAFGLFEVARRSGFFPHEIGRDVRACHTGGVPPHPAFRELARVASRKSGPAAACPLRAPGRCGLDVHRVGADRLGAWPRQGTDSAPPGQQLHIHERECGQPGGNPLPRSFDALSAGERAALRRLRHSSGPANDDPWNDPVRSCCFNSLAACIRQAVAEAPANSPTLP